MTFSWIYTPLAVPLLIGSVVLLGMSIMAWYRRQVPGAIYLCLMGIALAVASAGYASELGEPDVSRVLFWYQIEYLGNVSAAVFLLLMMLDFTGKRRFITPLNIILISIIPILTLLIAWTDLHTMIWQNITIQRDLGFTVSSFDKGVWYYVPVGYAFIVFTSSLIILGQAWRNAAAAHRRPIAVMFIGAFLPIGSYALYLFGIAPAGLDIVPYALVLAGLLYAFGMFGMRMLEVPPIALQSIYQHLPNAILIFDSQRRLVDINPAAEKLFNLPPGQSIGAHGKDLFARWPDLIQKYSDKEQATGIESLTLDGMTRHLDVRLSTLYDDQNHSQGLLVMLTDVTIQVEAESALRRANERLLTLHRVDNELSRKLDVDYVATFALDAAMRLSLADAAVIGFAEGEEIRALQSLGLYPEEVLGTRMDISGIGARAIRNRTAELILDAQADPDYSPTLPETKALISAPLRSGKKLIGVITLETKHPERFTTDVFESIQMLASRVAIAIDNARTYEERDELVSELDAFAHTVAHDLKNPINVISGYAELLKGEHTTMPPQQVDDFLNTIFVRSFKMVSIINSLLLLASVRGLEGIKLSPLDMSTIVVDVITRLENLIAEKKARILLPPAWPQATGYPAWVEEIWVNYISNALKYGGDPPLIELSAQEIDGSMIRFSVTDHGPGMTEKDRARLFAPFIRLEADHIKDGHGLGLSIVKRIATRLGGDAGVTSEVGKGSTFYFTLPVRVEQPEPEPVP